MLYLRNALSRKAVLHPGIAVQPAYFHSYDLSRTDTKECKIHKFPHFSLQKRKHSRHIELLTSVSLLTDTVRLGFQYTVISNMFLSIRTRSGAVLSDKCDLVFCFNPCFFRRRKIVCDTKMRFVCPRIPVFKPTDRSSPNFV